MAGDVLEYLSVDAPDLQVDFRRLALTRDQVSRYSLPTAPPKKTDSRSKGWTATCQLEALPPDLLASLVHDALEECLDGDQVRRRRQETAEFRRALLRQIDGAAA
jgi:hypothetical protein